MVVVPDPDPPPPLWWWWPPLEAVEPLLEAVEPLLDDGDSLLVGGGLPCAGGPGAVTKPALDDDEGCGALDPSEARVGDCAAVWLAGGLVWPLRG
jgi:hypothetical protein